MLDSIYEAGYNGIGELLWTMLASKNPWVSPRAISNRGAIVFLIHSLIYIDFDEVIRVRDLGRVGKSLDFATVMFQGSSSSKSNYRNMTLDLNASQIKELIPFWS